MQCYFRTRKKESSVIMGRSADYILKDRTDCLHCFIHASTKFKAERIIRLYGESEITPLERLKEKDAKRQLNYKRYTGREWGQCKNDILSLDSSVLGLEKCISLLADLFKQQN